MYPEDEEVSSRVNAIATKIVEVEKTRGIFKWDIQQEIADSTTKKKPFNSYHKSLDLAFLSRWEKSLANFWNRMLKLSGK